MFVVCNVQLVLSGVFCGNQSNCRMCILFGECLEMLEWGGFPRDTGTCRNAWRGWNVMNDWNVWNVWNVMNDWNAWNVWNIMNDWNVWNAFGRSCGWNAWNVFGWSCRTHGWISRRSPCLLCIEFLVLE